MAESQANIEEREDGPLVVKDIPRLTDKGGADLEAKPVMALCRCGQSQNKPFCDGSHKDAGFKSRGGTPSGRDRIIAYEGAETTVFYNPMLCAHAAECGRLANHIFDPEQKPWVQPDKGSRADVEAVVRACPSGALSLSDPGGEAEHLIPDAQGITIEANGPYWVVDIDPPAPLSGEGMTPRKYVLCRCGHSGNKPFCDGSHRAAGWRDEE